MSAATVLPSATEDFFAVYDFPFVLQTRDPQARNAILRLYRSFWGAAADPHSACAGIDSEYPGFRWALDAKAGVARDLKSALWSLESALCEAIIRSQKLLIAVHAAALYSRGSAVMLIGRSGAGKSTLSAALSQRGLVLGSDDVAFVDSQTLNVCPMPRCLHLDQCSVRLLEADGFRFPESWRRYSFVVPDDLDPRSAFHSHARLLIYIHESRADGPRLNEISQSEMTGRLWSEIGQGPLPDSKVVSALARLAGGARCFHLTPGSLSATADVLANLVIRLP